MAAWSTTVAIFYFSVYFVIMVLMAIIVWIKEEHKLDTTFLKSVWIQRTIYAQVIAHFYDTATDIGVLITWYNLWTDPYDYESVDMAVFFIASCFVLTLYRFACVILIIYQNQNDDFSYCMIEIIKRTPLALLDLYIFEGIYQSFKSSEQIIEENKVKAKKKLERSKRRKREDLEKTFDALNEEIKQRELKEEEEKQEKEKQKIKKQRFDALKKEIVQLEEKLKQEKEKETETKGEDIQDNETETLTKGEDIQDDETETKDGAGEDTKSTLDAKKKVQERLKEEIEEDENLARLRKKDQERAKRELEALKKKKQNVELKLSQTEVELTVDLDMNEEPKLDLQEIDPDVLQFLCMLVEAVFESMPQIILQTVFLVRSVNDDVLRTQSNNSLVFMSLIASIFNVANKFHMMDKLGVEDKAKSAQTDIGCPGCFGHCKYGDTWKFSVQGWYIVRIMWRYAHILCRFSIFSVMWILLGGLPFIIYVFIATCGCCGFWTIFAFTCGDYYMITDEMTDAQLFGVMFLGSVSLPLCDDQVFFKVFVLKWLENSVLLLVITLYTGYAWDCVTCSDSSRRRMSDDNSILTLVIIGWIAYAIDIVFLMCLKLGKIILPGPLNIPDQKKRN
eukprot:102567_1